MFSKLNMLKIITFFCFYFFINKISAQVLVNEEEKEIHEGEGAQKYWEKLEEAIQEKNELNGIDIKNRGAFRTNEFFQQRQTQQRSGLSNSGQWSQVVQANSNQQGGGMGRVEDVAFDPSNSNIFYVATAGGGLWKTNNDGASFFCVTSGLPVTGISSVVVDYSNTNIIYIFTGSAQGNTSAGVFKSINAGNTWSPTALQDSINGAEKMISYDLKMHPLIPAMLFAGTSKGLFKTSDGGITWTRVLERPIFDVEFKPGASNVIYAASYQNVSTSPVYGDTATWNTGQSLFSSMYPTLMELLKYQQIRIAVSPADPNAVWACASVLNLASKDDSIYLADGGSFSMRYSFNVANNNLAIQQMPTKIQSCSERMLKSGYGRDYSDIYVSSTGYIFIMGLEAMSSINTSGISWVLKSKQCVGGNRWMHVDAGKIKFNNGFVYACTDGGLFRQAENYTSANLPWTDLTAGLEITQSYVHAATPQDAEMYMYANQDNGTHLRTSATTYNNFVGGDGTACAINPTDKTIFYGSVQNGEFLKRSDGVIITPGAGCNCKDTAGYSGSFVFGRAFMQQPFNNNYLLAAKRRLYLSSDRGTSWTNKVITGSTQTHYIARVSTTNNSNTIYVVEDGTFRFLRSTNYGTTWTDLTAQKPYNGIISDIAISPVNDQELYMSFYGNDPNAKVFRSTNGGVSWTNLSNELPNVDTRTIALTGTANGIYVGNDFGVYYRDDNTNGWISFSNNLPIVFVMNLAYDATNAKISAATFGRGIWVSDAYNIADCPVNRTLNSIYFNRNTYSASAAISSTGTIYQDYNSRVTFSAENITLSPGFSASQNSNFIATPYGCLPNPILLRANNIPQNIPLEKDTDGNITNFNAIENK